MLFFALLRGAGLTLCVSTQNTQNFVENSQMGEKPRKIFDPQPDLRVGDLQFEQAAPLGRKNAFLIGPFLGFETPILVENHRFSLFLGIDLGLNSAKASPLH